MKKLTILAVAAAIALAPMATLRADEVEDFISEAQSAYSAGDIRGAKQALDRASLALAEIAARALAGTLPDALPGWEADEAETSGAEAMAMAMLGGGGMTASRTYRGDAGTVTISVMGDSPLLMMYAPMLANPIMAAAIGRTERINGADSIIGQDGQIIMLVANRFVITIDGSADEDDKIAYAEAIDLDALEAL